MTGRKSAAKPKVASQANGDSRNIPPSTITAQIVEQQNHQRAHGPENNNDDVFAQLLEEVRANPGSIETDVEANCQLIRVVAKAGLEPLIKPDPFISTAAQVDKAVACIDVIEIAIKRTPESVTYVLDFNGPAGLPMCVWILPNVFAAVNVSESQPELCSSLQRLLGSILNVLKSRTALESDAIKVERLYRACAEDLIAHLEKCAVSHYGFTDVALPSAETLRIVSDQDRQPLVLEEGSQTRITSPNHAVAVLLLLIFSSLCVDSEGPLSAFINHSTSSQQMWLLRILSRAVAFVFNPGATRQKCSLPVLSLLLKSVHNAALVTIGNRSFNVICQKAGYLVIRAVTSTFTGSFVDLDSDVQFELERLLILTERYINVSQPVLLEANKTLRPSLIKLEDEKARLQSWSVSLQEVISRLTTGISKLGQHEIISISGRGDIGDKVFGQSVKVDDTIGGESDGRENGRPSKRQKVNGRLATNNEQAYAQILLTRMCSLLGDWDRSNLEGLAASTAGLFSDLIEADQIKLLHTLIRLPCAGKRLEDSQNQEYRIDLNYTQCDCFFTLEVRVEQEGWNEKYWTWFEEILSALTNSSSLQSSKKQRILLAKAAGTFMRHTTIGSHRDLGESTLGRWCLQNLRSSIRELRIAAGFVLPAFLLDNLPAVDLDLCRKNRIIALDTLQKLVESEETKYFETSTIALGQIACACGDDEMNIVLLRLVEYLGHANTLICSAAHLELRHIAQVYGISVELLMKPFWRSIAITVVKDLLTRPQKAQQLADLLSMSVAQFLNLTQSETLPYLVLWKRQDILQKLVTLLSSTKPSVWNMCMVPQNLAAILSLLIVQNPTDLENTVMKYLSHASSEFSEEDVANLLKVDPIAIACEVLKIAGDEDGSARVKAIESFRKLTIIVERRGQPAKASSTQARMAEIFFENHALGIMASFSDIIDSPNHSAPEKKRCLRAIEQMIDVARSNIRVALPQIRACLQSALEKPAHRDDAFIAWTALLSAVDQEEDLESLIIQTFTALVLNWDFLSAPVQQRIYDSIATLFKNHGKLIQNIATSIPSLTSIPLMSKFESQLARLRSGVDVAVRIRSLTARCQDENSNIVLQALRELVQYLEQQQTWIYENGSSEQPGSTLSELVRSLLDACVRFKDGNDEILEPCTKALGLIGCLDPNRIETIRDKKEIIILSNFALGSEAVDFVSFLLEHVLVKAFHAVSNPRAQGFLAYVMQELLKFCRFTKETTAQYRPPGSHADDVYQRWTQMPETVQATLRPFLSSRYVLTTHASKSAEQQTYPIFTSKTGHGTWLRTFVYDLLQKANGDNSKQIFGVLSRIIRGYDIAIAAFLLPFAAANVIIGGTDQEANDVGVELRTVLEYSTKDIPRAEIDHVKSCSENVFQVLDYLSKWLQEKKREMTSSRTIAARAGKTVPELEELTNASQIESVETILSMIPADIISRRAVECGSYARALFHWEQFIRQEKEKARSGATGLENEFLYQRLQDIYKEIDEPDGIDGISSFLQEVSPEQQVLEHKRAGRWTAAQSWYEIQIQHQPENIELHVELLDCLQQTGKHHLVLDHVRTLPKLHHADRRILSMVSKATWSTARWADLEQCLADQGQGVLSEFNTSVARAMLALRNQKQEDFASIVRSTRLTVAKSFSESNTTSMQACHDQLLKLHAVHELESISCTQRSHSQQENPTPALLTHRLGILGSYLSDKQYLLGLRRAAMSLSKLDFSSKEIASSWMASAKLARKENWSGIAYNSVLHATELGDESAKIEQARLLWNDGEHRKAIKSLEGAISANAFHGNTDGPLSANASMSTAVAASTRGSKQQEQNLILAKAHLLLAKWLDTSGQTQSLVINQKYQQACRSFQRWEKGFYYLGRFYNKLLESQKQLTPAKQNLQYLSGETTKLVVENWLRSLVFGCKYLSETLPKLLTLWLEFGNEVGRSVSREVPDDVRVKATQNRPKMLDTMNKQVKKYIDKISAYLFYTALPQMITRMGHSNKEIYDTLALIIIKVVTSHPQQGLWPLLAVVKSSVHERAHRGSDILNRLKEKGKNIRNEGQSVDLKSLVQQGLKLSDQLIHACEVSIEGRAQTVSLTRDLGFNQKVAPCPLVVPLERTLSANLPGVSDSTLLKQHKAFPMSREAIAISSFTDDVLVLNSLQKPRKLTVRGSNGQKYALLCKPNDDLRKDQRLMEFNAMINRSLKKDSESAKRRLYVKTYAVTPLNEACGLIEWVDGLKPMRDILISSYRAKGIKVDYNLLRELLNESCSSKDGYKIFTRQILPMYPPVLHEWFSDLFPDPDSWFAARLRYTRSCAVSSMVGYALGLGDRHGENVLLEENSGGIFHVDFNCLFEKGLTFDKPELVPFRLTHNMVDAFGAYGVEGPFRRSAECTMKVMRANEDALLTILETFVYDPTADFVGTRKRTVKGVPETPREVLDNIRSKVRGLMKGESVPLSVGGHVDALIMSATDAKNLCAMYIGWCAFL